MAPKTTGAQSGHEQQPKQQPKQQRLLLLTVLAMALGFSAVILLLPMPGGVVGTPLSTVVAQIDHHQVASASVQDDSRILDVKLRDGKSETTGYPNLYAINLTNLMLKNGVKVTASPAAAVPLWRVLISYLPMVAIAGVLVWYLRKVGALGSFSGGRGKKAAVPKDRFSDVGGADEAVEELREVVDFLHNPAKYKAAGARPRKGILLVGPPGTGKTLLARAVAGEAGVPFFAVAGSDFVQMYAGVGAQRVRSLFDNAKKAGHAIVFIDEIDSVGKKRTTGSHGGAEERENTLNMLLSEMDGFGQDSGIVVLAATNRPDSLDPALTRPGRFDRHVTMGVPDVGGRSAILKLEAGKYGRRLGPDVDLNATARRMFGLSGADLGQVMNEAALVAARSGRAVITQADINTAFANTMLGTERRSAVITDSDRAVTAHHEAGHAVAALVQPNSQSPVSVSIVPRGPAGGVTWMEGTDNVFLKRSEATARLVVAMAGRAAEELLLGWDYTQGAEGDLRAATSLATEMVAHYGMGERTLTYLSEEDTHVGRSADVLHEEVDAMLERAHADAVTLLVGHKVLHTLITEALMQKETLDADDLSALQAKAVLLDSAS